jgi:hypothetical protein
MIAHRLKCVTFSNFRGWGWTAPADGRPPTPREVNTDADIVLVTGANGFGKSSLLEAILIGLTGQRQHNPPSGLPSGFGDLIHRGEGGVAANEWRVALELDSARVEVFWPPQRASSSAGAAEDFMKLGGAPLTDERSLPPHLVARAISFFQEAPRDNLDLGAQRSTLYEWYVKEGKELKDATETLKHRTSVLRAARSDANDQRAKGPNTNLADALGALRLGLNLGGALPEGEGLSLALNVVAELLAATAGGDTEEKSPRVVRAAERVDTLRGAGWRALAEAVPVLLNEAHDILKQRIVGEGARARESLEAERELRKAALGALRPAEVLEPLDAWDTPQHGIALTAALRGLAEGLPHWLKGEAVAASQGLGALIAELRRLDCAKLDGFADAAEATVGTARKELAQRRHLEARVLEIEDQLREINSPTSLRDLARAVRTAQNAISAEVERLRKLAELPSDARYAELISELEALAADAIANASTGTAAMDKVNKLIHKVLDHTLVRFQPREGFLPVRVVQHSRPAKPQVHTLTLGDGTTWADASTGQKAQLSLGWMLAQVLALQSQLPARVLLLDDTSTAFDQGNLSRQVTWLRQLAYNDDPDQRWQIFLASHHDELTSRLAEMLRPPGDRTLRVIDFTGWRPGYGPEIKAYHFTGAAPTTGPQRGDPSTPWTAVEEARALEARLEQLWTRPADGASR